MQKTPTSKPKRGKLVTKSNKKSLGATKGNNGASDPFIPEVRIPERHEPYLDILRNKLDLTPNMALFVWLYVTNDPKKPRTQKELYRAAGFDPKHPDGDRTGSTWTLKKPKVQAAIAWLREELGLAARYISEEDEVIRLRLEHRNRLLQHATVQADTYVDWGPADFDRERALEMLSDPEWSDAACIKALKKMVFRVRVKTPDELPAGATLSIKKIKDSPKGGIEIEFESRLDSEKQLARLHGWEAAKKWEVEVTSKQALYAELVAMGMPAGPLAELLEISEEARELIDD